MLTLTLAAFATAVLSATLGMAGGLVLMGAFAALLPVPDAMVMHGLTQLVANGGRALTLRTHVDRPALVAYAGGALAAAFLARLVAIAPPVWVVYLGLGLVPFVALALPRSRWLDAGTPFGAGTAGLLVVGTQSLFGVAGPLLDTFFQSGRLDRFGVVATKAATQALSHVLKVALFLPLVAASERLFAPAVACMAAAVLGTQVGTRLLARLPEADFRLWTRRVVLLLGAGYLVAGVIAARAAFAA